MGVSISPPDLSEWAPGNTGIPGVMQYDSGRVGLHLVLVSLIHGNEFAGAIALDHLIRQGLSPRTGVVSVIFAHLEALARFDRAQPAASRFIEEDMNRVWDARRLASHENTIELRRARELLPVIQSADILLDLHSMLWDSAPLLITPDTRRSRHLATVTAMEAASPEMITPGLGTPDLIVTDLGHAGGPRLIEQERFVTSTGVARSMLLEAGQHWDAATVRTAQHVTESLLRHAPAIHLDTEKEALSPAPRGSLDHAFVTDNIIARSGSFSFVRPYRGSDIVAEAGTVIACDGDDEICTPYDRCLLVMPNLRPRRGQLAVRLARLLKDSRAV